MKVCVLASGSKGNSSYIETTNTKVLVDIGMSTLYIEKQMQNLNIDIKSINSVILTHTHVDHINGLKVFIKKYNPTIYLTQKMFDDIIKLIPLNNYILIEKDFIIDDLNINIIKTSHDSNDSNGYIFEHNNKTISYITDTGYINKKHHEKLKNKDIYIMESNHDIEMLMNGRYPYHLKQRILGDSGHLSNKDCSKYLSNFIGENTKEIVLIHISHENNHPDIALKTIEDTFKKNNIDFKNITISKQEERTELIEL